jgi:UDPglucose--hexose-1-phosphate uridylyltransferase
VAIGVLPHALEHRHAVALRHAERTGRALIEDLAARELEAGARVVEAGDAFVAFCPFASHRVYETWVVPRVQSPSFGGLSDALLEPFAEAVVRTVARVRAVTKGAAYNLVVRTPPVDRWSDGAAGWHLEVLPRTGGDAGFELGTGMDVVPVAPEDAAEELRGVKG